MIGRMCKANSWYLNSLCYILKKKYCKKPFNFRAFENNITDDLFWNQRDVGAGTIKNPHSLMNTSVHCGVRLKKWVHEITSNLASIEIVWAMSVLIFYLYDTLYTVRPRKGNIHQRDLPGLFFELIIWLVLRVAWQDGNSEQQFRCHSPSLGYLSSE